jgi:hypothetical protein
MQQEGLRSKDLTLRWSHKQGSARRAKLTIHVIIASKEAEAQI